jgi:REP element-mobilizing transposase RayT
MKSLKSTLTTTKVHGGEEISSSKGTINVAYSNIIEDPQVKYHYEEKPVQDYFHLFSDGGRADVIFLDKEDVRYAKNLFAFLSNKYDVKVLIYAVMSNHIHAVLHGDYSKCLCFMNMYKRLICRYFSNRQKNIGVFAIALKKIATDQMLKNEIIYVYKNPVEAGLNFTPDQYYGGVGRIFFCERSQTVFKRISDMSYREKRAVFHTDMPIPESWFCDSEGTILPSCYIAVEDVQMAFRNSVKAFLGFMSGKKDQNDDRKFMISNMSDRELRYKVEERCEDLLHKKLCDTSPEERLELARNMIVFDIFPKSGSMARALNLSRETIVSLK